MFIIRTTALHYKQQREPDYYPKQSDCFSVTKFYRTQVVRKSGSLSGVTAQTTRSGQLSKLASSKDNEKRSSESKKSRAQLRGTDSRIIIKKENKKKRLGQKARRRSQLKRYKRHKDGHALL